MVIPDSTSFKLPWMILAFHQYLRGTKLGKIMDVLTQCEPHSMLAATLSGRHIVCNTLYRIDKFNRRHGQIPHFKLLTESGCSQLQWNKLCAEVTMLQLLCFLNTQMGFQGFVVRVMILDNMMEEDDQQKHHEWLKAPLQSKHCTILWLPRATVVSPSEQDPEVHLRTTLSRFAVGYYYGQEHGATRWMNFEDQFGIYAVMKATTMTGKLRNVWIYFYFGICH
ncbi:hypothetical protein Tco_0578031 [Tanacetum coccineum]